MAYMYKYIFFVSDVDNESHETEYDKPIVFLTVSSLASHSKDLQDRTLELNWDRLPSDFAQKDPWLRLYDKDPLQDSPEPIVSFRPQTYEGYFR